MRWLFFVLFYVGFAWYCYYAFKTVFKSPLFSGFYVISALLVLAFFLFHFAFSPWNLGCLILISPMQWGYWVVGFYLVSQ